MYCLWHKFSESELEVMYYNLFDNINIKSIQHHLSLVNILDENAISFFSKLKTNDLFTKY